MFICWWDKYNYAIKFQIEPVLKESVPQHMGPSGYFLTSCPGNVVVARLSIATTRYFGFYKRGMKVELIVYTPSGIFRKEVIF